MNEFFNELRSRKVYRVAVGYIVAGWVLIQVCATVFPAWDLPRWFLRAVIVVVLTGFPIALVLAWAFDIKAAPQEETAGATRSRGLFKGGKRNFWLLVAFGLTLSAVTGLLVWPLAGVRKIDKSIAVLPFDNFSDDRENEFFADGVHDDVLTSLAKVADLKVISRTSVMPYRGQPHNLREIGHTLGVSKIVEGSVRRSGNRIRLVVQLIDAATDRHLWAQEYDRELMTDVFALQSSLARDIARQLQAKLSPDEKARMEARPTENNEAYRFYLEAHDIFTRPDRTLESLSRAADLYGKATQIDPSFALAFAQLSQLESYTYYTFDPTSARLARAKAAAEQASRLQPDLAETHLALGYAYYYGDRDYDRALAEFELARRGMPNDCEIFRALSAIKRRQGKWKESIDYREKAAALSPNDPILFQNLGTTYNALREFSAAAKAFDRAAALAPNTIQPRILRARIDIESKGDLRPMRELLATLPDPGASRMVTLARFNLRVFERNFAEALAVLARSPLDSLHGETSTPLPKSFLAAQVYRVMPDPVKARESYEKALLVANQALTESPQDPARHVLLGLIYAGLGRKEEALVEGGKALELLPETKDAFDGPIFVISMARIHAINGDPEKAIDLLEHSLKTPAGVTVWELRFDPTWDSFRNHPRFQALIK